MEEKECVPVAREVRSSEFQVHKAFIQRLKLKGKLHFI